jgi:hypothetical protein
MYASNHIHYLSELKMTNVTNLLNDTYWDPAYHIRICIVTYVGSTIQFDQVRLINTVVKLGFFQKLPPYTPAGFDLTTHKPAGGDDSTYQGQLSYLGIRCLGYVYDVL